MMLSDDINFSLLSAFHLSLLIKSTLLAYSYCLAIFPFLPTNQVLHLALDEIESQVLHFLATAE